MDYDMRMVSKRNMGVKIFFGEISALKCSKKEVKNDKEL